MMAKKKREFPENPVAVVTGASRELAERLLWSLVRLGARW